MQKPSRLRKSQTPGDPEGYPRLLGDAADLGDTRDGTNAAQQALRESEDRYRELVDGSLAGTLVTRGEATLFASRRLAEIFGYLVDEFLALESIYEIVAPSDRERLRRYEESRLAGMPAPERYEFEGVRKDRTPVWVEISVGIVSWESEAAIQATIIDITDRKWAEQALAETADQYRALVEGSIEGILIRYGDKPIFVNDMFAEMFGYTTDEILALDSIDALLAPHERERLRIDQINRMRGREAPSRYEFEGVSRDGVQIWLETSARVVAWRGKLATQSTVIDITERKRAEQELRESEQKFRNLIEGSIEGILIRRGNKLVFVNQHMAEIFGYSTDELLGLKSIDALFAPASRSLMRKFYRDRVRGDPAPERYEFEGKRKDGSRVWLEVSVRAVTWDGAPAVQATLVDRTQRRLEEEKRRDSEAKFRNLVEGSIQAVAVVDRKLRPRFVNPAAATMFGFDSAEELLSIETLYPHIAASDRKLLRQQLKRRLAGDDVPASYQFRGIRKDGTEIWLQNLVRTVDWDGEKCVQATLIDITDRKRAELAAVEARDSLQRIIDTIPAMVSVKDRERRYTLVNKYLRDTFGTSVIGKRARLSAPTTRLLKQEDEQVLATGEVLPFHEAELTFKGESKTWLQTKVPLKNDAGEIDHILSVSFDITERKRVEEELRESEARYRSFIEQASDAVLIHSDGIIVLANSSAADLLAAASADELQDQSMMAFVDPTTHDLVKDRVGRILKGKTGVSPVEQIWRRVDGARVEVEVSGSHVHWRGRPAVKVIARDITERKKTDADRRMLQYAVDKAVDAVYWMRPDGGFDYVNDAAARMLGYTRDELMALNVWTINPNLSSRDWAKRFAEIKKGSRRSEVIEYTHRAKDGTLIKVEATTNYVRFGDEEFAFGFVRDVRERKLTEAALQMTQFAVDSAGDAVYLLRPDGSFAYANDSASVMLGYSRNELESMAVFDINPDHTQQTFKRAFGRYKRKRGPSFVEQRHQAKDGRIVPVEISANYFSFGEQEGLFAFARDISERKAAETSMRESEARYRSVVELSPDPILINCEGRIAFINSAGLEPLGFSHESDIVGKDALAFVHPESRETVTNRVGRALNAKTGAPPAEFKWVRPDGVVVELESSTSFISWEGKPALQVVARDITQRKRTEQALQLTQFAIDQASEAVYLVRPDGRFDYANAAASEMLGYSPEELRSMSVQDINPEITMSSWKKRFALITEGTSGTLFTGQMHKAKNGDLIPVEISGNYYRFGENEGMVSFVRDVSTRVATETAMRESEARYRSVVEQSPDAIFINCEGKLVFVNSAGAKLFKAKSVSELIGRDAISTIHPKTRELARQRIKKVIETRATVPPTEQRWLGIDGTGFTVESTASYVVWSGKPALQVVARDITERKRTEHVLKLTQFAVDRGFDAVIRVSPQGSCVDANDAACQLLGYTRDELLTMGLPNFVVGLSKKRWHDTFCELRTAGRQSLFRDYRRKDGRTVPVEVSINYVRFDDEEYAIGFARDISERKRAEDALRLTQFSVDTAADPIVWIKPDGRFAYANMAATKHFGYAPDKLLKLTIADVNRGISINSWKDRFRRLKRKRTQTGEYEHLTRDGRMVPVEITDNYIKFGDAEYVLSSIRDITERKRHETDLKESEARYRRLIDQAPDAILIVDDKQILFANPAAASLLGYRRPQLIMERTPFDIVEPDVRKDAIRRTRRLLTRSESVAATEQRLLKRDGTTVEVEVTGSPIRWLGRAAGQFIIRDITERKRTENALRMTQFAIDNSSDGITWLDRKGNFSYVNQAMAKLLGYSIEELLKMRATDLNPHQTLKGWGELFDRLRTMGVVTNEYVFQRKDGSSIAVEVIDNYFKFGDREYAFSSIRDISERKQTEDALRMTQFAVDTTYDGIFWVDRDGRFAYANEAAAEMLGYTLPELLKLRIPDTSPWQTIKAWRSQFDELRRVGTKTDELPLLRQDGSSVAVEVTDNHFKFGAREYIFSYVRDITDRKRTESALRLTQFAVHNASDGIFWTGRGGELAYANEAAARLLGYESGSAITGLNVTDINPAQTQRGWERLFEEIKRHSALTSELRFRTKDGGLIPVEITDNYFVYEDREYIFAFFRDITERKRTEDALRLTQFSVDNATGAVFWARADGSLSYMNAAACLLLDYGTDEYQSLHISDIDPHMTPELWRKRFAEVRANPQVGTTEVTLRAKSGKLVPAEITDNYIKFDDQEYIFAFAVDISERKAAEAELREREQQLESVTRNIPGSVFQRRQAPDGTIEFPYVSAGSKLVWGVDPEAVEKNPDAFMEILHPEDRKELEVRARESAKDLTPLDLEFRAFGPDGETRWARVRSSPRRLEDGSVIWDGVSLDETERKLAEQQVREHESQLAHIMRVTTMGEMATALAHELGQPLNAIANYTRGCVRRLQSDTWDRDEITHVMEQACEQAERAALVVRDIAEFIRGSEPERIPCDVNEIVGSARNLADAEANDKGVRIAVRLAKSLPPVVVDSIQIEQVLLNLMRNGIEAMSEAWSGSGLITVRTALLESGFVRIDVRDSGPPANADNIEEMFEAFHSTKVDGMGMGLAISRTIVEAHEGQLWATPNNKRGFTFHFTLPVEQQRN